MRIKIILGLVIMCAAFLFAPILHADLSENLVGYWQFENTADDSSGTGNHGSLQGDASFSTTDPFRGNYSLYLDGTGDYVSVPDDDSLDNDILGGYTVSAWVKRIDVTGLYDGVVVKGNNGERTYGIWVNPDEKPSALFEVWGGVDKACHSPHVITLNEWHHLVYTWDGTYQTIYVDDYGPAEHTEEPDAIPSPSTGPLTIGRHGSAADYWYGYIDEVAIWSTALSGDDIEDLFNGGAGFDPLGGGGEVPEPVTVVSLGLLLLGAEVKRFSRKSRELRNDMRKGSI